MNDLQNIFSRNVKVTELTRSAGWRDRQLRCGGIIIIIITMMMMMMMIMVVFVVVDGVVVVGGGMVLLLLVVWWWWWWCRLFWSANVQLRVKMRLMRMTTRMKMRGYDEDDKHQISIAPLKRFSPRMQLWHVTRWPNSPYKDVSRYRGF